MTNDRLTRRRKILVGGAGLAAAMMSGCTDSLQPPPVENVQVGIADFRSPSIGVTSATLPLIVEFVNSGGTKVPDIALESAMYINAEPVTRVRTNVGTLEPNERIQRRLNTIIYYSKVGGALRRSIQQGDIIITLEGSLTADGLIFDETTKFRAQAG